MKNLENIKLVLDKIESNPECWEQISWHCGASHCFAGWSQILSGKQENPKTVKKDARIFLGLSRMEANYYFNGNRNLHELKTALLDFYDENGYGLEGYNREGYNSMGYNRFGYDLEGHNIYGFSVIYGGYDQDGYNIFGFNSSGYDRDGYDYDDLDINNNPKPE